MESHYVHGYSEKENARLNDQAATLTELLHHDTRYPERSRVLEAGCGVGAQTVILAKQSPHALITSVDISESSLLQARSRVYREGVTTIDFCQADIFNLPFQPETFDHVFVCFVLEHLPNPVDALKCLKIVLKPGGTITVIEGDHGSVYFHPDSRDARTAIQCQIMLQAASGGNALIGRELYPLLIKAGFRHIHVSPRMVYVDASRPGLVDGFTKKTFTAMIKGVEDQALRHGLTDPETFKKGIRDLYRTTEPDGTFCYTFFKGTAIQ